MTQPTDHSHMPDEEDLEQLLLDAGRRPMPSQAATDDAYAALKSDWAAQVAQYRQTNRRRYAPLAAAAAVVFAVFAAVLVPTNQTGGSWQIELTQGAIAVGSDQFSGHRTLDVAAGDTMLATAATRLQMGNGTDLRLHEGSRIRWVDRDRIFLIAGRSYIDTGAHADFAVDTALGQVRDIGTQYMVSVLPQNLVVAVREGTAAVDAPFGTTTASAHGQNAALLHIDRSGAVESMEPASDPRWDWIHAAAAGYIDRSVPRVLEQISRDLGKRLQFKSRGVEATIANDTVQGELAALHPRQALELVTNSAGLSWTEDDQTITIDFIH